MRISFALCPTTASVSIGSRIYKSLYVQVLAGIARGRAPWRPGPETGAAMRPLGDGFIKLIKMLIAPIMFATIVVGIAQMGEMQDVGRIGLRAFLYFEVVSTLALVIGLVVVNVLQPGAGLHVDPSAADVKAVGRLRRAAAQAGGTVAFLLNVIPTTVVDAFARGDILQVLLVSMLVRHRAPRAGRARRSAGARRSTSCRTRCSRSSASSCGWRRSAPSARWRSPSAATAIGIAALARQADGRRLPDLPAVHRHRARRHSPAASGSASSSSCATSARKS